MPTYQYACTECDHFFEQFQSFSEDALTVCPECGGKLRKVFNAVGVVFKGSGFYRNDSRATSSGTDAASGSGSGSGSSGSGSGSDSSGTGSSTKTTSSGDSKAASGSASAGSSTPAA